MSVSTAKAATVAALTAGLALAASGPAAAFPTPRYSTTLATAQAHHRQASKTSAVVTASQLPAAAANPADRAPEPKPEPKPATPAAASPATGAKGWSVYVVQKGDTLTGVGRRFGAPVKTLSDLNELDAKSPVRAGMKLKLPPGTVDSGRDPYASGPSPFALGGGGSSRPAASSARHAPAQIARAEPRSEPPPPSAQRPSPEAAKPATTEPHPARLAAAVRPVPYDEPPEPRVTAAPKPAPEEPLAQAQAMTDGAGASDPAVAAGRGRFVWPVKGTILSHFGPLGPGERNDGVNIGADRGADVHAAAAGEVVYAGSDVKGFGNVVLIKHADGWVTAYAHLGAVGVRIRDHVEQGQKIGSVGETGGVDQPQLHFEARWSSAPRDKHKPVDPLKLLP